MNNASRANICLAIRDAVAQTAGATGLRAGGQAELLVDAVYESLQEGGHLALVDTPTLLPELILAGPHFIELPDWETGRLVLIDSSRVVCLRYVADTRTTVCLEAGWSVDVALSRVQTQKALGLLEETGDVNA